MKKSLNIVLLVGGCSEEREVSLDSGKGIYSALVNLGHNVTLIDPGLGISELNEKTIFSNSQKGSISPGNYSTIINDNLVRDTDLFFIGLHGRYGEDGIVQSILNLTNVPYTGSGVLASALAMDKNMSKMIFRQNGIRTPKWVMANGAQRNFEEVLSSVKTEIGYPCIVKPNSQGSTIGLTLCNNPNELIPAIERALMYSTSAMIEEYISGAELTVAIANDIIFPVLEIKPKHLLYDYECKYSDGMSEYFVPANISKELEEEIKKIAKVSYDALDCKDYSRIDFRLGSDGLPYCFEINTLPGMTTHSLVPKMARAAGYTMEDLVQLIIDSAIS